ncbi:DegT/DnrJ/EryC1/StrS family aminotransferase [Candidatus Woesearchaeota archaeon]|nr:DegT/DnrJ/EryC1/StrS family aminotransferase [Candidatus Woesearchaeota archaeon]
MNIPFVDLKSQYHSIKAEVHPAIERVLENTAFILGQDVKDFEERFARFCQAKHCVGVSTGSAALVLALKVLGIKPGDEVITAANTYIATSAAITLAGGRPRFVDVDPETYNISTDLLRKAITPKTKAILPVHLYGQPADMKVISEIAEEKGIDIVEDAAQAHGSEAYGKRVPFTNIGCFSFYPGKNLGAYGDGGAVVTNRDDLLDKLKVYRDQGRRIGEKYVHDLEWTNERLDNVQAAILNVKMNHIEQWTDARRRNAKKYNELLSSVNVVTPAEATFAKHVYHLYIIQLPPSASRDMVMQKLKDKGIATGIHYPVPLHLQPAYQYLGISKGALPVAERLASSILSLPMFPELTEEQMQYVAEELGKIVG